MKKLLKTLIFILVITMMPVVNAKSMKATDYIQKIADDAGGNKNSIEVIGNTDLAYDGTVDNNLRYVGTNPKNFIYFNDELWRVIGIMNNVQDENGNKSPKLKIIREKTIDSIKYDFKNLTTNASYSDTRHEYLGGGVNEWSDSTMYRVLNPGFENNINPDYNTVDKVNNSLYWNRQSGYCLSYKGKYRNNNYTYTLDKNDCDYSQSGLKEEYKKYIANVLWNTGTVPSNYYEISVNDFYNYERGEARKCTPNSTTCNDTVERKSSTLGRVGIKYASDIIYSSNDNNTSRELCFQQTLSEINGPYNYCFNNWLSYGITMTPIYDPDNGNKVLNGLRESIASKNGNNVYPVVYLESNTKIVGGNGYYGNPFIIGDSDYQDINNDSNKKVNSNYKGNYSIDYLTNNYNIVTFGTKDNNLPKEYNNSNLNTTKKGNVTNISLVEGPVLINNDFNTSTEKGYFSVKDEDDKSFIKGELGSNMLTPSKVVTNKNYVDFNKMYAQVVNEQQTLVDNTEYNINKLSIEINTPGIYMINNTRPYSTTKQVYEGTVLDYLYKINTNGYFYNNYASAMLANNMIFIDNYNPNKNYIFNIMNEYEINNYVVNIKSSGDPAFKTLDDIISEGNYTGNIIFNYPNAKYIEMHTLSGTIIAPKADVYMPQLFIDDYNSNSSILLEYNTTILANSINGINVKMKHIQHKNKIVNESKQDYVVEPKDYNDDLYTGDYALKTLLKNYNVVTLGQKEYQNNTKFKSSGYHKGSTSIFHISGQFLVGGDLGSLDQNYQGSVTAGYSSQNNNISNMMRFDLESNFITESYLKGNLKNKFYIKNWSFNKPAFGSKNDFLSKSDIEYYYYQYYHSGSYQEGATKINEDYINFKRLYDNIVAQQKAIKNGQDVKVVNGVAHIKTGSNYIIKDINKINEIVFDNFEDNKDLITMITIENEGNIKFPKMRADTIGLISTNDHYGKKEATQRYEIDREFKDYYHGNIVWNVPSAKYIKLAANAPFAGHLIAPNADVESPETQLAGAIIANSFFAEGTSELHFYPLTAKKMNESYVDKSGKRKMRLIGVNEVLREDASIIKKEVIGDYQHYLKDQKSNSVKEILTNPATYRKMGIITLILLLIASTYIKAKSKRIEGNSI